MTDTTVAWGKGLRLANLAALFEMPATTTTSPDAAGVAPDQELHMELATV